MKLIRTSRAAWLVLSMAVAQSFPVPVMYMRAEDMLHMASEMLHARGMAERGEAIVFVAGVPAGIASTTNVMKLHRIGEEVKMH